MAQRTKSDPTARSLGVRLSVRLWNRYGSFENAGFSAARTLPSRFERAALDVRAKAGRHPCGQECAPGFGIEEHDQPGEIAGLGCEQRIDEIRPYADPVQSVGAAEGLGQPAELFRRLAAEPERPTVRLVRKSRSVLQASDSDREPATSAGSVRA